MCGQSNVTREDFPVRPQEDRAIGDERGLRRGGQVHGMKGGGLDEASGPGRGGGMAVDVPESFASVGCPAAAGYSALRSSGTGKTLLVRALATEAMSTPSALRDRLLTNGWAVGEGSQRDLSQSRQALPPWYSRRDRFHCSRPGTDRTRMLPKECQPVPDGDGMDSWS